MPHETQVQRKQPTLKHLQIPPNCQVLLNDGGELRDVFPGYYRPTQDELSELWNTALIILDTNALFNLFRYSNITRQAFLSVLEDKEERLWIPHQVGLEFQRGRLGIIKDQSKAFTDLITKSEKALASVTSDVGALRNHPTLDLDELRTTVRDAVAQIKSTVESTREKYQTDVLDVLRHDETTDKITELYTGRVGQPYEVKRLEEIYNEGETRYNAKQPPGYKDASKPAPDRYGDLVLWFQVLDKAEADQSAIIFVSEDQKEDWWREFDGRKIGPRVELVDEFMQRTGKRAYFLTPPGLVELANEYGATIAEDTVREITEVSAEQARIQERLLIHSSQTPPLHLSTHELEDQIRVLRRRHREMRSRLRALDERRSLPDPDEPGAFERYTRLNAEIPHYHHEIDALTDNIERIENELSKRRQAASRENHLPQQGIGRLEIARVLLNRADVTTMDDETDWFDVPDTTMEAILESLDSGNMPPKFEIALRDLPMPYEDQGSAAGSPEESILNHRRRLDAEKYHQSRVARNREARKQEDLRALTARRRRLSKDNPADDDWVV